MGGWSHFRGALARDLPWDTLSANLKPSRFREPSLLIDAEKSALLTIDIQDRLNPVMADGDLVVANIAKLLRGARLLGVPVLASEQYPKGLGHLVGELADLLDENAVVEKDAFSCMADDEFAKRFTALGKPQAIVCGIEAHVCVNQTALQLLESGVQVFVVSDATSSRTTANHMAALERLRQNGAEIVSAEMVLFEWLRRAGTPEFKEISKLVK